MKKKLTLNITIPVTVLREGKSYVAYSPAFDLSTSADSFDKAQRRFTEVVSIFLEETIEKGTLESVLGSLGWHKVKRTWAPPTVITHQMEPMSITVPA